MFAHANIRILKSLIWESVLPRMIRTLWMTGNPVGAWVVLAELNCQGMRKYCCCPTDGEVEAPVLYA